MDARTARISNGQQASWKITVKNISDITVPNATIMTILPPNVYRYVRTSALHTYNGVVSNTNLNPVAYTSTPEWGTFTFPPLGKIEIEFTASVEEQVFFTAARYGGSTRVRDGSNTIGSYVDSQSGADDIEILPNINE
jgi:uncharacterized repeat protein (TIGR01451 family)